MSLYSVHRANMCNWKKSDGSTQEAREAVLEGADLVDDEAMEDDVFTDTEATQATVRLYDKSYSSLEQARASINIKNIFKGWNKKSFMEKVDAVSLDFWLVQGKNSEICFQTVSNPKQGLIYIL